MKPRTKKFECPNCAAAGEKQIHSRLCISNHTDLKEEIMSGAYFQWECANCGNRFFLEDVFLYNDDEKEFMVYLVPGNENRIQPVPTVLKTDKKYDVENSTLRIAANYIDFVEKIRIFDAGLDDCAIETVKAMYSQVIAQEHGDTVYQMLFETVTDNDALRFALLFEDDDFAISIPREAYDHAKTNFAPLLTLPSENEFVMIDQTWLSETLKNNEH